MSNETEPTPEPEQPEGENETLESIDEFLVEKQPSTIWEAERQQGEHIHLVREAQRLWHSFYNRLDEVANEGEEIDSVRRRYYQAAFNLLILSQDVLSHAHKIAGKKIPEIDTPDFYRNVTQNAPEPKAEVIEWAEKKQEQVERGEEPNYSQAGFSELLVETLNNLDYPGDEVAKLLKDKNLLMDD